MTDTRSAEDLKDLGAGKSAPRDIAYLYDLAFEKFGTRALWNWQRMDQPTITQVLTIANSLRIEGNLQARALAVEIEKACRAAL